MVNTICAVSKCRKESYPGCGITFHKLPPDVETRRKWKKLIGGKLVDSSVICSNHFKPEDYLTVARKRLKPGALPSVFPIRFAKDGKGSEGMFVCPLCYIPFVSQDRLRHHKIFMHADEKALEEIVEQGGSIDSDADDAVSIKSEIIEDENDTHIKLSDQESVDDGSKDMNNKAVNMNLIYLCIFCNAKNKTKEEAEMHILTAHKDRAHEKSVKTLRTYCTRCNKFVTAGNAAHRCVGILTKQRHNAKGAPPELQCAGCGARFADEWSFQRHAPAAHARDAELYYFRSWTDFTVWKQEMQREADIAYGNKEQSGAVTYESCVRARGPPPPRRCPSVLRAEKLPDGVLVHLYKRHCGHAARPAAARAPRPVTQLLQARAHEQVHEDRYIQFKTLMDNIVTEAAKLDKKGLDKMFCSALQMTTQLAASLDKDEDEDDKGKVPIVFERVHLDNNDVIDPLEEIERSEICIKDKKTIKRSIEAVLGTKVIKQTGDEYDSAKRTSERVKRKVYHIKHDVAEKKRKTVSFSKADDEVKTLDNTASPVFKSAMNASLTFADQYKDFVANNLKESPTAPAAAKGKTVQVKVKVEPKPKTCLKKQVVEENLKKTTKKEVEENVKKATKKTPPKLKTKLGQFIKSPPKEKDPSTLPVDKVDLTKVKIAGYKVKERQNDCNILVLKI